MFLREIESQYVSLCMIDDDNFIVFNILFSLGINRLLGYKLNH